MSISLLRTYYVLGVRDTVVTLQTQDLPFWKLWSW